MLEADSKDPWELIPEAFAVAKEYDNSHEDGNTTAYAEAFALWAWVMKKGKVSETRYFVHPDDREMKAFNKKGMQVVSLRHSLKRKEEQRAVHTPHQY
eukprot:10345530-Ditylum_brightwellii.AAC.1